MQESQVTTQKAPSFCNFLHPHPKGPGQKERHCDLPVLLSFPGMWLCQQCWGFIWLGTIRSTPTLRTELVLHTGCWVFTSYTEGSCEFNSQWLPLLFCWSGSPQSSPVTATPHPPARCGRRPSCRRTRAWWWAQGSLVAPLKKNQKPQNQTYC